MADKRTEKDDALFLYIESSVYYLSKQVPCDIKAHYSTPIEMGSRANLIKVLQLTFLS